MLVRELLRTTGHRPYSFPSRDWLFYQEWNDALFLHWEVNPKVVSSCLPDNLELDLFEGMAWISLVIFTMNNVRPRFLPPLPFLSDFHEINLRTYVKHNGGVYFLSIDAGKYLASVIARKLSGLPYAHSKIHRENNSTRLVSPQKSVWVEYEIGNPILGKSDLDTFLTERYSLTHDHNKGLLYYDVHHIEWQLNRVEIKKIELINFYPKIPLESEPKIAHHSTGVQVLSWSKRHMV